MKKRGFGKGRWNGVGGKLEPNESVEQAMIRETQEEINVTPIIFEKMADINFDQMHDKKEREQIRVHIFIANKWRGVPQETEEMAPKWFTHESIPYQDMWADDIHWLPKVLQNKKLICSFVLNDNDQVIAKSINEVTDFNDCDSVTISV